MKINKLEKEFRIHVYETGPNGKLSLFSLFDYFQDIASDQAILLGFGRNDLLHDNRFWVLSRIYAVINKLPEWEESIKIRTWPNGVDKIFALRNYEVEYPDGSWLASATSSWLILDRTTKKIQRPDSIMAKHTHDIKSATSPVRYALKLNQAEENGCLSQNYRIKVSDLDVNLHTNNVKYLKWVCDTYDLEFMLNNTPLSAEINYLAESMYDEEIMIRTSVETENGFFYNHSIIRTNDNKELCRIRIEWEKVNKI